ncbi:MAG: radical SAM/SPASM domain-containing protein [Geobacteraceae bacterium]|nr:radical SAM/SPASM domain-containing protein [Geobacteraceae bacterium]
MNNTAPQTYSTDTEESLLPALRSYPSRLFVETTTRCNMKCHMCVKQSMGSGLVEGDLSFETFEALEPALARAEAVILNGIGEPLINRNLEAFIRRAKELMPEGSWVGFQSNGLMLSDSRASSLVRAGLDRICLSLDAICPDTFRKIREGGEVKDMEQAFAALNTARKWHPESKLQVGVEFVVMRDNIHQLPDVLRWAASLGVSFAIVSHLLPYDKDHVSQIAYDYNTLEAVELYTRWRKKGEEQGIDISNFFHTYHCKFLRTTAEQRMVDFVLEMMAEARARDIFLHLENLMKRDVAMADDLVATFDKAKAVAEEIGLDLRLPGTAPKNERKCDFIDNGGVFVSWDGDIHPCYFLWHTFQCHFSGRKKFVNRKAFGNVNDRGILEIWNDPDYRAFREEVLKHEYPFCSNCNLLPCEYIYCEEFEQDCYTNTVPCGDCFWCMGLFQCLS